MTQNRAVQLIACANQKGGVGKTTTSVVLGHGLAMHGIRTLLVDLDPQGHLARVLGLEKQPGLYQLLHSFPDVQPDDVIVSARDNLDLLPGDQQTERAKQELAGMGFGRERILRTVLEPVLDQYEVILFDFAPSADILHQSAVFVSDWLLIPTKLADLDFDGVAQVISLAKTARELYKEQCTIDLMGVLPTFYDRRYRTTRPKLEALRKKFEGLLWAPIPTDSSAIEAPEAKETLWEYAPDTRALQGFTVNVRGEQRRVGGYASALERMMQTLHKRWDYA